MLVINESPMRQKIIMLFKKFGGMSVDQLSKHLSITPMGVRQHLIALEKKGIITYDVKRHGIGRPKFLYNLTDRAVDIFPQSYNRLLMDILHTLKNTEGEEKLEQLFELRMQHLKNEHERMLPNTESQEKRVRAMVGLLNSDGYLAELEETPEAYKILQYNCPIGEVTREFSLPCKYELKLYRSLFSEDVHREAHQANGDPSCTYVIPRA